MKNLFKNNSLKFSYLFLLGVLTSFSLPPYNYFIINFFTLGLFFVFIVSKKNKREKKISFFNMGWFFGFGYFLSSLYWISFSLTFDDDLKFLIPLSLIIIPAFLAIFYGIALYIFSFFIKYENLSLVLIFSIIFGVIEFIRGNILTGFPWNLFAFSFSENLKFIQILSIFGTYAFNMICITFFLTPIILILKRSRKDVFLSFFFVFIGVSFLIYGNKTLNNTQYINKDNNFLIKIVSPKIPINRFYNINNEDDIVEDLIKLSRPNPDIPTIFIWPEGMLTSTYLKDIKRFKYLFSTSFSEKHLIVLGINDLIYLENKSKIFNTLVVVNKHLDIVDLYRKNYLVPFGEFLPLENYLNKLGLRSISHGYESFSGSEKREIINLENRNFSLKFLPLICYEIIYSGKLSKNNNFDLIINISEDGWFGKSIGPHQHFSHSIFRAIEEGKNIVRSSNNGISAYINSRGRVLDKIESTKSSVIEIINLDKQKETIFSTIGNNIFFYLLIIYISFVFFINKRRGR